MDEKRRRIYLDNAATSWPKPPAVIDAITNFYQHHGSAAGRGFASDASDVDRSIERVRTQLANFLNVSDSRRLVFTFNGTDSLNMAIRGVLSPGDHVITSVLEHNSVLRPLHYLQQTGVIDLTIVDINASGVVDVQKLDDAIVDNTRLICLTHASNVLGTEQPIEQIGKLAKPDRCLFLVDAAQSVGHLPVDMQAFGCDLLASSGHKGLLGPLGTGFLALNDRAAEEIEPLRLGGTGTVSEQLEQPSSFPSRLESGNLNAAGILAMGKGLEFIQSTSLDLINRHVSELRHRVVDFAIRCDGIELYGGEGDGGNVGVVSFQVAAMDPSDVAVVLDAEFGIQTRAGLHCAPLVHKSIGSDTLGGTVRLSIGYFNANADIDAVIEALTQLTNE